MSLSAKHKAFCDEYLSNGLNQLQAYKSVYKCSDKAAQSNANRLMENEGIKDYIQKEQEKTSERLQITKEELLRDLQDIKNNNKGVRDAIAMKAIEIINKMSGFDAPIKQDITIIEEPPLFSDDDLAGNE
jgi:phage terminase small subunit